MKFPHLKVPDQWNTYFSKYPQGYTILEALIEWVGQVDNMADHINSWNDYLDNFVATFDKGLQDKVIATLSEWQESGFLDIVISQALQTELDLKANGLNKEETFTIYVSPSGNDDNDGTQTHPLKTIQKAFSKVEDAWAVIAGKVRIDLAEGVYEGGIYVVNLSSKQRIELVGKTYAGGQPSVFIDGSIGTPQYGISLNGRSNIQIKNITFQNFRDGTTNTGKYGITTQTFSDLLLTNVTIKNCGRGVMTSANSRLFVEGGIIENCAVGIETYANVVFYIGYQGVGTLIKDCTLAGLRAYHQTEGHIDYSTLENNNLGIDIKNSSRVHAMENNFINNEVGLYCVTSSTWYNHVNHFTGNKKDIKYGTYSNELSDRDLLSSLYRVMDAEPVTHTGNTDLTIVKSVVLPRRAMQQGNAIKVKVYGTFNLSTGNTCDVTCYLGGTNIYGSTSTDGSTNMFNFEWDIIGRAGDKLLAKRSGYDNDTLLTNRHFELNYNPDIVLTLSIRVKLTSPTDSVTIDGFQVEHIYG